MAEQGRRRSTRIVRVGDVEIGGANPIRIQSMTTSALADRAKVMQEVRALHRAGCELVRVTVPSLADLEPLAELRAALRRESIRVPLVADVHFTPRVALAALEHADKVRINPGNFVDRRRKARAGYSDQAYAEELDRIADAFVPVVQRAKGLGRALRIGVNHGSLSERILVRYGDTPLGMVESALEFGRICAAEGFGEVIYSMKSSNPLVMIEAYRLLARRLDAGDALGAPLHLGVTEAGTGIAGRVKSAVGIGTLIEEGLGDTIRVSLTEPAMNEIPVARALAQRARPAEAAACGARTASDARAPLGRPARRRPAPPRVELEVDLEAVAEQDRSRWLLERLAEMRDPSCEGLVTPARSSADLDAIDRFSARARGVDAVRVLRVRVPLDLSADALRRGYAPIIALPDDIASARVAAVLDLPEASGAEIEWAPRIGGEGRIDAAAMEALFKAHQALGCKRIRLCVGGPDPAGAARRLAECGAHFDLEVEASLRHPGRAGDSIEALIEAAVSLGTPLCEGHGMIVSMRIGEAPHGDLDLLYHILQASRARSSRPEFISCPSCGRTQFDLETVSERIRGRTGHLQEIKIAIMGCIVNGPGEMADADFGYVGSGPGTVHLYVGRERVEAHVPEAEAPDRLEALIRRHGRWTEAPDAGPVEALEATGRERAGARRR